MEGRTITRKTDHELEQEMYFNQFINVLADLYIKYADEIQPIVEARDAELRKLGSSLKQEWEKVKEEYNRAMETQERSKLANMKGDRHCWMR